MSFRPFRSQTGIASRSVSSRRLRGKRRHLRRVLSERLEDRRLLAGPELLAIRPDASGLLRDGDVLQEAPREFNLYFRGGADLDETTINASTVRLIRSGGDGSFSDGYVEVALGYVGLVNPGDTDPGNLQQIVIRPASTAAANAFDPSFAFPDDLYRVEIIGSGASPLANRVGEAFADGTDFAKTFRLDRGAQVVAVVPQPVTRNPDGSLRQASDTIVVHFDDQLLNRTDAEDPQFYRLVDTRGTLTADDDQVWLPQTAEYDADSNSVTLVFGGAIPEGNYRLDIGRGEAVGQNASTALRIGTLFDGGEFVTSGFMGDRDGRSDAADDVDVFRLQLPAGAELTVEVTPQLPELDLRVVVTDAAGAVSQPFETAPGQPGSMTIGAINTGAHFIEISSPGGNTGGYLLRASVTGNPISDDDNNSTFDTSTDLGVLGAAGVTVAAAITPQRIPLPPFPGSQDEPGHRLIQKEAHIGAFGTTPTFPTAIRQVNYQFPTSISGFPNQITEEEKRIVRGLFTILADVSGYEFVESTVSGIVIGKTDLRAFDPTLGPDSGVAGLGGGRGAIVNAALYQDANRFFGDGFTSVMFHEIGHAVGLGHSYELPSLMGEGTGTDILLGDHDIVHLQRISPPNATDIDMYRFEVPEAGRVTVETFAERLPTPSLLNTVLTLYRQNADGSRELVSRNDRYFGNDSWIQMDLEPGTYFVGVTSTGNDNYDPEVPDSGFGGTTDGPYRLSLEFRASRGATLRDADGTPIDGNGDGRPGGAHSFWFQAGTEETTIFVDRANDLTPGVVDGDGSLADPFDTLSAALARAGSRIVVPPDAAEAITAGDFFVLDDGISQARFDFGLGGSNPIDLAAVNTAEEVAFAIADAITTARDAGRLDPDLGVTLRGRVIELDGLDRLDVEGTAALLTASNLVRIVGNGGADGDLLTPEDNLPYLVGVDEAGNPLRDGGDFLVPQGTTVMIEAGALFKMRRANLDAGTSAVAISRAAAAIQVLGTPDVPVWMRSFHDDRFGGDSDGAGPAPRSGDFGGIVFRGDSDLERQGIFLNHVTHVDILHGGGKVFVDSVEDTFAPITMRDSRPAVRFNQIAVSDDAAMSASPNSFDDSLGRLGPQIVGNYLVDNSINGLFVRIRTEFGSTLDRLTVPGRFANADIAHVLTENLVIEGNPGGPLRGPGGLVARASGRLVVDPGVVVKMSGSRIEAQRGGSSVIAEGTENRPVVFTSLADDRFGGSGTFDTNSSPDSRGAAGDWGGFYFGEVSSGSFDRAIISFGGGETPIEGDSVPFNVIEIHQADVRIANSLIKDNADGNASGVRNGRGGNQAATIYVRGAQPIVLGNTIVDNAGPAININANSLNFPVMPDRGRGTGRIERDGRFDDNRGPLVRLNRLANNSINGMLVRGEQLTTESIWDDTDIVHVLQSEIVVDNHHTFSGLRLQSGPDESLVVKLAGANAGFTATGTPLDIVDRVGGTIHVLGTPGHPVILTHLGDDSVGAGFSPDGSVTRNTNNSPSPTTGQRGGWRGLVFDEYSNDRNVAIILEREAPLTGGRDINRTPGTAQFIGELAPDEKSGDENRRLGFEVHGFISPDDPRDVDVYSFRGTAGTPVWIDIDRTDPNLDVIVELINVNGTVQSRSVRSGDLSHPGNLNAPTLTQNPLLGGDFYTQNFRDAGMYFVLPGSVGAVGEYFVRVRSNPQTGPVTALTGRSSGHYQLQIRLQQRDEFPGSTVQFADLRFAGTAIDVRGLPRRSPFLGEAAEIPSGNQQLEFAQPLINLLGSDMAALSIAGSLASSSDVDFYRFDIQHEGIQVIPGANDDPGTVAVVFDIDFADGLVRPDTTLAVFDAAGNLIFVGRESNIEDDLPTGPGLGTDDLSRGSFGTNDPFIGPVHVRATGTYYVAVMSNESIPSAISGQFLAQPTNTDNMLVRLEPINTVRRVVEDRIGFQGHRSLGTPVRPETDGIFDVSSANALEDHVIPFRLEDVGLFVATDNGADAAGDHLYIVNPARSERFLTRISSGDQWVGGNDDVQDIVIRSDGRMYGVRRLGNAEDSVGALVEIDPGTGAILSTQNDNIPGRTPAPNTADLSPTLGSHAARALQFSTSNQADAFTFRRVGTSGPASAPVPNYNVYYAVRESDNSSKLYRGREDGDASPAVASGGQPRFGVMGFIQPAGVVNASSTMLISSGGDEPDTAFIRFQAKAAGPAGNGIQILINRPDNTDASVASVSGNTIVLDIGGTGGPPPTNGPSAADIVNAVNNDENARRLVTAVIVGGNGPNGNGDGGTTAALVSSGPLQLSGGAGTPLAGHVTGLSFGNFFGTGSLYGVTSGGEFLQINRNTGAAVVLHQEPGVRYEGLALGPQNAEGGRFANWMFAITADGQIHAYDTDGVRQPFATNGSDSVNVGGVFGSGARPVGLAFSPLDFNLWHPTMKRGADAGHGVNPAPDDSRNPSDESISIFSPGSGVVRRTDEGQGGLSFHFGFEQWSQTEDADSLNYLRYTPGVNAQLGIRTTAQHADLSSNPDIVGTYNFPGGAMGSLVSGEFSLTGSVGADRPTLYFNYFLDTENHPGSNTETDVDDPFRDSARVFISSDGGLSWDLLATNNSRLSDPDVTETQAELPGFLSHRSDAGTNSATPRSPDRQVVQELFDSTGQWRQARVDLSRYAGLENLQLRFDFSTAGAMRDPTLGRIETGFGEFVSPGGDDARSIRSLNNAFEGFYIDDIIVGYAERGEMVTGTVSPDPFITNLAGAASRTLDRDPERFPNVLSGPYQLEIRRVDDVALLVPDEGIMIFNTFDTNDRHITDLETTVDLGFEDPAAIDTSLPGPVTIGSATIPTAAMVPWEVSDVDPLSGLRSLRSGELAEGQGQLASVFQTTAAELGSTNPGRGLVSFTYRVSSLEGTHGLMFLIDGVPQLVVPPTPANELETGSPGEPLASGEVDRVTVRFPFSGPNSTFTWLFNFLEDQDQAAGQNRAWIDDLLVLQGGTGFAADRNRHRPQGAFILDSNIIRDSLNFGINVEPGPVEGDGGVPRPGSTIQFAQRNSERLVPGVVIRNNIVAGSSGIRLAGELTSIGQRPVPFDRVVNNTLVGAGGGTGVQVVGFASPTVMNNIITGFGTGVGGATGTTVLRSNYFQDNGSNGPTGSGAIVAAPGTPLFIDAANGNYNPVESSAAIDSSLSVLQDRFNFVNFKNELGVPPSPLVAPDRDIFGQLRVDSSTNEVGGGSQPFIDRGAVDLADTDPPYAVLLNPRDNDQEGNDRDPNATVVWLRDPILENFRILIGDGRNPDSPQEGTGADPLTVTTDAVIVRQNNRRLVDGVDYVFAFNDSTGELRLTPLATLWEPSSVYEITLDNTQITDLVGNRLRGNRADGSTAFTIVLPDIEFDFGDAPQSYGTLLADNGARHALIDGAMPRLGAVVDGELDGQPAPGQSDDEPPPISVSTSVTPASIAIVGSGTSQVRLELDADYSPVAGDLIMIRVGDLGETVTFELVPRGIAPGAGNLAIRFDAADTAEDLAVKIAERVATALADPGDGLRIDVDPDDPLSVRLQTLDDEDGVGVGVLRKGIDRIVFLNPGVHDETFDNQDVLGFLNPLDPAGSLVAVEVLGSGFLDVWIDFNQDGVFHPTQERVAASVPVSEGINLITIQTPANAPVGETYARFRLSPLGGLLPTGLAVGGEVEDHVVEVISVPLPVPADDQHVIAENSIVSPGSVLDTAAMGLPSVMDNDQVAPQNFTPVRAILGEAPAFAAEFSLDPDTGHFIYQPLPNFVGIDTFTYRLANQAAAAGTVLPSTEFATVTIDVRPVNDPPLAQDQSFITPEDTAVTITAEQLLEGAVPHFDPQFPPGDPQPPFDESNQSLRVIAIRAGDTMVTAANAADGPFATANGTVEASFDPDTGSLIELSYLPDTDLNRDNATLQPFGEQFVFDLFEFTIEDDGISIDPATIDPVTGEILNDVEVQGTPRTHTATALIDVSPQNDPPIAVDDLITVGMIGAGSIEPIDESTAWSQYFIGLADDPLDPDDPADPDDPDPPADPPVVVIPVPTEDQPLLIPAAFLLRNDAVGPPTAQDELDFVNDNDGPLSIIDVEMVTPGGGSVSVDDDGNVLFVPPPNRFGEIVFRYTIQDQGIDEDIEGNRVLNPLTSVGTVTVMVQPVNDPPVAYDRALTFTESEDPGPSGPFTFTAAELLLGMGDESPAIPGPDADDLPFPFDETDQSLRVVRLRTAAGAVDVEDLEDFSGPGTGSGTLTLASDSGGTFEFDFEDGALVVARFTTAPDYNRDTPFAPLEELFFTIEDDGSATDPQTDAVISLPAVRAEQEARLAIEIVPANDAPVFVMPPLFEFDENDGEPVLATDFVIDLAPGPFTALDELQRQNLSVTVTEVNVPEGLMADLPSVEIFGAAGEWLDDESNPLGTANLTVFPSADAFGFAVYEITFTDDDEENPRSTSQLVTIAIHPVNDVPVAFERAMEVTEAVEADGETAVLAFDADRLIFGGDGEMPAVAGLFPEDLAAPYNETEQTLRVVRFEIPGAEPVDVDVDEEGLEDGTGTVSRTTVTGGTLTFVFESGAFVSGTYEPAVDYNSRTPFDPTDEFAYVIADDGRTTLPGSGFIEFEGNPEDTTLFLPELRSAPVTITITVNASNDPPVFDFEPVVHILERDDEGVTVIPNWATNILPGPPTALDELQRQSVSFQFVADQSSVPDGLFRANPTVSPDGTLSLFPAIDAVGMATIVMRAVDFEFTPGFVSRSTEATFTVFVQPVNDPPRVDPDAIGLADELDDDHRYQVGDDGVIRYTLREDAVTDDGVPSTFFVPLQADSGSGFQWIGLFDVLEVGPENEAGPLPGGSQTLSLASFQAITDRGGMLELGTGPGGQPGLIYTPPENYNRDIAGLDGFQYTVIDNSETGGETYQPGPTPFDEGVLIEDRLTFTHRVEFELIAVNDPPQFELAIPYVEVAEDTPMAFFNNVATEILAGPPTAIDQIEGDNALSVMFVLEPLDFTRGGDDDPFGSGFPQIDVNGQLTFRPLPDVFGLFEFDVRLVNSGPGSETGRGDNNTSPPQRLAIEVQPVNDPPFRVAPPLPRFEVLEDNTLVLPAGDIGLPVGGVWFDFAVGPDNEAEDILPRPGGNQNLSLAQPLPTTTSQGGTLETVVDDDGNILEVRYTPRAHYNGPDSFTYTITDDGVTVRVGTGGTPIDDPRTVSQTVRFDVLPVNDPPIFSGAGDVSSSEDDGPVFFPNWAFDIAPGPEGAVDENQGIGNQPPQQVELVITQIEGDPDLFSQPPIATVIGTTATLSYTTAPDANGVAVFEVFAIDDGPNDPTIGDVNRSPTRTFTITVAAVNDPPTFLPGGDVEIDEDSGPFSQQWATEISPGPPDEADQTVSFEVFVPFVSRPLFTPDGLPQISDDGVLTFTTAQDANGVAEVRVTAVDSEGGRSDTVTFQIIVAEVNDPPIGVDDEIFTAADVARIIPSSLVLANDIDPDLATNPDERLIVVMPPVLVTPRGAIVTFDSDTGRITYDPTEAIQLQSMRPGETLVDQFDYIVQDLAGEQDSATVFVTVEGRNVPPTVVPDTFQVNLDQPTLLRPLDNDFDIDGTIDPSTVTITRQPNAGAVVVNSDGTVTFIPQPGFTGFDSFRYTVSDDLGQPGQPATVNLVPASPPIAAADTFSVIRNRSQVLDVTANDEAQFGELDLASLQIVSGPSVGQAITQSDGTVVYIPPPDFLGTDSFSYTIRDDSGFISNVAQVVVSVIPNPGQNPNLALDVNGDELITAIDALLIINKLNRDLPAGQTSIPVDPDEPTPPFFDVNGDGVISSLDALLVINALSRMENQGGNGEGESVAGDAAAAFGRADVAWANAPETVRIPARDWIDPVRQGLFADSETDDLAVFAEVDSEAAFERTSAELAAWVARATDEEGSEQTAAAIDLALDDWL